MKPYGCEPSQIVTNGRKILAVHMAEASIAASVVSVEPVAWPEVGQFDRLLQRNAEANAEGSES
jgi:hypothetical protein